MSGRSSGLKCAKPTTLLSISATMTAFLGKSIGRDTMSPTAHEPLHELLAVSVRLLGAAGQRAQAPASPILAGRK